MFGKHLRERIVDRVFREGIESKEEGAKIVGVYCAFTPKEIIAAAGAIPVALCAGSQQSAVEAEKELPRNLCPLIKSTYGHALADTCPYMHEVDLILADATCDGKKKMFELLARIKPLHLLSLPQTSETEESLRYWLTELYKVRSLVEQLTGNRITDDALEEQIRLYNACRQSINAVYGLNRGLTPLLYGRELAIIMEEAAGFECNLEKRIANMYAAISVARERAANKDFLSNISGKPKVLLTGCPSTNNKVLDIIEESGGIVVAMENCGGLKTSALFVDEGADPMLALAERYLRTACPCMSPNKARLEIIKTIVEDYRIDGVVELTWEACHTYNVEAFLVKEFVTGRLGLPYVQILTDYSEHDSQQIKLRIEAFLELI